MATDSTEHAVWGPLGDWEVTLTSGDVVRVTAHAYEVRDDEYVFSILMRGSPAYFVDLIRIPVALVTEVEGG
jgi:hypothetical protein